MLGRLLGSLCLLSRSPLLKKIKVKEERLFHVRDTLTLPAKGLRPSAHPFSAYKKPPGGLFDSDLA